MAKLELTFKEPIHGWWDCGKKSGGEFEPNHTEHPGKDVTITWGCFRLNFWFRCGSGRSWKEAAAIAKRRLSHLTGPQHTIEIVL